MSVAFALSIHHFINSVGADAGFAAIIGLAILVLLFFAQARETASLRDRAAESDEHVHQLELRLAQLSRAPAPAPAPPGVARPAMVPAPAGARAASASTQVASALVSAIPAAPAGVGAPALSSATRLIPDHVISIRANDPAAPSPEAAEAAEAAAAAGVVAATGAGAPTGLAGATTDTAAAGGADSRGPVLAPGLPPATAAGGANGGSTGRVPPPVAVPRPAGAGRIQSGSAPPPLAAGRSRAGHPSSGRRRGIVLAVIGALVIAAAVVVALILNRGSGSSNHSSNAARSTRNAGRHRTGAQLAPSDVRVTVLNGTSINNLAHDITKRLGAGGYKTGTPLTASSQTHTTTIVGYTRGHRAAALLVAKSLALSRTAVQPVAAGDLQVACPQTSVCPVQVIVTLGTDLASAATSTTTTT